MKLCEKIILKNKIYSTKKYGSNFKLGFGLSFFLFFLPACDKSNTPIQIVGDSIVRESAPYVGSEQCKTCHSEIYNSWSQSHHGLAMQKATDETVLGNFNNFEFRYFDEENLFYKKNGHFWVSIKSNQDQIENYKISYVFGITPLQQYLVQFPDGRIQVLSVAWDTRKKDEGGQRWFHLYPNEYISKDDPLHWKGREHNWNYMCAECHSTNIQKNYDIEKDTFDTKWSEISVGCEGCHGPGKKHISLVNQGELSDSKGFNIDFRKDFNNPWIMNMNTGIAQRKTSSVEHSSEINSCGRCHSRRSSITANYEYGLSLLDTHMPALLDEGLYFSDGQIHDEVFVWGSFLQSRMYQKGVTCSDCHDPHSAKLKTNDEPSSVCSTCHLPSIFNTRKHHNHDEGQTACVDCHMPSKNYMIIDGRRDHSFHIPRPEESEVTGLPIVCSTCHTNKTETWVNSTLKFWYGEKNNIHFARAIHAGREQKPGANTFLIDFIGNENFSGIIRATGLSLLSPPFNQTALDLIKESLLSSDALIRMGALRGLNATGNYLLAPLALPMLEDSILAVRLEAFKVLSPVRNQLQYTNTALFKEVENEYIGAQLLMSERPEAHINLGNLSSDKLDNSLAEEHFLIALKMEPNSAAARINLADLYRKLERNNDARLLLERGLLLDINNAALHHSIGLTKVRLRQYDEALVSFAEAVQIEPQNRRYIYVYAIALHSVGKTSKSISILRKGRQLFPNDYNISWGLVTILRDHGENEAALTEALDLRNYYPDDSRIISIIDFLEGKIQ